MYTVATKAALLSAEMTPRLFDLDMQLIADSVLSILAVFTLFLALSYFLFNPAREFLARRQEKIRSELENAQIQESEAVRLKEEYEARLAGVQAEADEILSSARKKAIASENRIISQAKEEAARIIARANVEAELEKKKMADEVKQEMVSLASVLAGKAIGASMDLSLQEQLIEDTLKEIGEETWLS